MSYIVTDLKKGFKNYRQWFYLAYLVIKRRYAMSIIGPNWTLLANTFFILSVGFLFSGLNQKAFLDYFVFLCFGYLIWTYLSEFVNGGSAIFLNERTDISNGSPNLTGLVLKFTFTQILLFAHNLPLILIALFVAKTSLLGGMVAILAFCAITANLFMFLIWVGTLCARFRDVSILISTVMRIMFFLTPIIWHPDTATDGFRSYFVTFNPFHYAISLCRDPLLLDRIDPVPWVVVGVMTLVNFIITFVFFRLAKRHLVYWVQ